MGLQPENEAPPTIDDHAFEPKGHWYTLCIHCGLAESAHETTRYMPPAHEPGIAVEQVTRDLAPSAELRAAALETLELLELLVQHGRSLPLSYSVALRIKIRLRNALAATS